VCSLRVTSLKTLIPTTKINRLNDTTATVSDLYGFPWHTDPGRRALLTCAHLHDFQNATGAQACIPQREIAAVHGAAFGLALDALYAVDVRQAASDTASSPKQVGDELAAELGTLARVLKLVWNASLA
jgi:Delta3,5-Delta2,4-dienoyl-CoA isomerase